MKKPKRCAICKTEFVPVRPMQKVCGFECAKAHAENTKAKAERISGLIARKELWLRKESAKTRADWMKEAQQAVNAYIRARDAKEPCISCGRHHEGQYHAGHFRSRGSTPALRFEELNIHKQCSVCNNHLSGNLIEYRIRLKEKIGQEALDWLEGHHEPKKYSIEDLKSIKAEYKQKLREVISE